MGLSHALILITSLFFLNACITSQQIIPVTNASQKNFPSDYDDALNEMGPRINIPNNTPTTVSTSTTAGNPTLRLNITNTDFLLLLNDGPNNLVTYTDGNYLSALEYQEQNPSIGINVRTIISGNTPATELHVQNFIFGPHEDIVVIFENQIQINRDQFCQFVYFQPPYTTPTCLPISATDNNNRESIAIKFDRLGNLYYHLNQGAPDNKIFRLRLASLEQDTLLIPHSQEIIKWEPHADGSIYVLGRPDNNGNNPTPNNYFKKILTDGQVKSAPPSNIIVTDFFLTDPSTLIIKANLPRLQSPASFSYYRIELPSDNRDILSKLDSTEMVSLDLPFDSIANLDIVDNVLFVSGHNSSGQSLVKKELFNNNPLSVLFNSNQEQIESFKIVNNELFYTAEDLNNHSSIFGKIDLLSFGQEILNNNLEIKKMESTDSNNPVSTETGASTTHDFIPDFDFEELAGLCTAPGHSFNPIDPKTKSGTSEYINFINNMSDFEVQSFTKHGIGTDFKQGVWTVGVAASRRDTYWKEGEIQHSTIPFSYATLVIYPGDHTQDLSFRPLYEGYKILNDTDVADNRSWYYRPFGADFSPGEILPQSQNQFVLACNFTQQIDPWNRQFHQAQYYVGTDFLYPTAIVGQPSGNFGDGMNTIFRQTGANQTDDTLPYFYATSTCDENPLTNRNNTKYSGVCDQIFYDTDPLTQYDTITPDAAALDWESSAFHFTGFVQGSLNRAFELTQYNELVGDAPGFSGRVFLCTDGLCHEAAPLEN